MSECLANAAKDVSYYQALARELDACSPLARQIASAYDRLIEAGMGPQYVSRMIDPQFVKQLADKEA